jgi:hypothetical protein
MGPEEETVDEARQRYLAALRYRQEASDQAQQAEWARQTPDVIRAREAYDAATRRQHAAVLLRQAFELTHPKTENINGL